MGTRHLIAVQLNGEYRVAQYGQWDGYPSGQGVRVLEFLRTANLHAFAEKVAAAQWLADDEANAAWVECGAHPDSDMVSLDVANRHSARYPERSRDTGAKILPLIMEYPAGIKLRDSLSFAADSLFCEWAYVIDLDTKKLEVFKGFNHSPLDPAERFAKLPQRENASDGTEYHPVRKVAEFDLGDLPSKAAFLAVTEPADEEEAA